MSDMDIEKYRPDNGQRIENDVRKPDDPSQHVDGLAEKANAGFGNLTQLEQKLDKAVDLSATENPAEATIYESTLAERNRESIGQRLEAISTLAQLEPQAGPEALESINKVREIIIKDAVRLGANEEQIKAAWAGQVVEMGPNKEIEKAPNSAIRENPIGMVSPDADRVVDDEEKGRKMLSQVEEQKQQIESAMNQFEAKVKDLQNWFLDANRREVEIKQKPENMRTDEEKMILTMMPAFRTLEAGYKYDRDKMAKGLLGKLEYYQKVTGTSTFGEVNDQDKNFSLEMINKARATEPDGQENPFGASLIRLRSKQTPEGVGKEIQNNDFRPEVSVAAMIKYFTVKAQVRPIEY
ncbi:MAG: hypothetical protein NTW50_00375 [Candidatus Berkelbacteria bacterium]|nr:hypothetical protein [Candidatus Berkelbacteria bacterium]